MTVLVTGGTGLVGSAVLRRLLADGHAVRALVRPSSDRRNLQGMPVEMVQGDLREPESLAQAAAGCSDVFHVAADYRLWVRDPRVLYESNVTGTRNMMLAAAEAGVRRIVYTSSVATLGLHGDGSPADEETPVSIEDMIGHYKRSKFLAEAEVRRLVKESDLPVVIVNPSTPIGPRDIRPTPTGRMILDAAAGRMPAFVDTGLNVVHVDDVAEGHLMAWRKGGIGERYILGGENMSLQRILAEVAAVAGRRPPKLRLPHNLILPVAYVAEAWARVAGVKEPLVTVDGVRMSKKRMYFSSDKASRELGYCPRPAVAALRDAVQWFLSHGYC